MTNYMTVNEAEMDELNVRLWRIKQAIEKPTKDLGCPKLDAEIMKLRYKATKFLRDVLFMQQYVWECASEEEKKSWNDRTPDPKELVKEFDLPVDEKLAESMYKDELDVCGEFGPDNYCLSIYDPMDWWKDLPEERKKEFHEDSKKFLEKVRKMIAEGAK